MHSRTAPHGHKHVVWKRRNKLAGVTSSNNYCQEVYSNATRVTGISRVAGSGTFGIKYYLRSTSSRRPFSERVPSSAREQAGGTLRLFLPKCRLYHYSLGIELLVRNFDLF